MNEFISMLPTGSRLACESADEDRAVVVFAARGCPADSGMLPLITVTASCVDAIMAR